MGIHYDYKSTRGDKAMKKEAKRKARIEQRRAKRSSNSEQLQLKVLIYLVYLYLLPSSDEKPLLGKEFLTKSTYSVS